MSAKHIALALAIVFCVFLMLWDFCSVPLKIPSAVKRYWLAMNATAFDSAIHACAAFFAVAGAHAAVASVPALTLTQFCAVFIMAFARAILAYLDTHPVAEILEAINPTPPAK